MRSHILLFLLGALLTSPIHAADGFLSSLQMAPDNAIDLSAEGSLDWAHWGLIKGHALLHRKSNVSPSIGDLVKLGEREAHTFENNVTSFRWSDGTPTASIRQTNSGLFSYGQGNGFCVSVPADQTTRTLKVYAGVWRGSGKLEAELSDGSAPRIVDSTEPDPAGEIKNVVHVITYRAAGSKQALTVKWTNPGTAGNVEFIAVALRADDAADREPNATAESTPSTAFPLRVSDNGRYLVDSSNRPFFYHADTAWRAIMALTKDEAISYLDDRRRRGFTALHMHIINKEKSGPDNRAGEHPFVTQDDITRPNKAYWEHVDEILRAARERGFFVALSSSWFGYDGSGWRDQVTVDAARKYGEFLGERYGKLDNLLWVHVGDNDPGDKADAVRALVDGIRQHAPHHLHTAHNHPEHASRARFPDDDWLDVNLAYTYKESYLQVAEEWQRPNRPLPIILGETGYEGEKNPGYVVRPYDMRRQAWWALLSGASGHAIGSGPIWCFSEGWDNSLDLEGTRHARHIVELHQAIEWWRLIPDFEQRLVTAGGGTRGNRDYVAAARADDASFAILYLPSPREITVNIPSLLPKATSESDETAEQSPKQSVYVWWFNPRNGQFYGNDGRRGAGPAGELALSRNRATPPSKGTEDDWVLLLSRSKLLFTTHGGDIAE